MLTEAWHIAYFWVSYGRCAMTGSPMGCSEGLQMLGKSGGTSGKYQETCLFACFWDPYGSLAMLGLSIGVFVGLS